MLFTQQPCPGGRRQRPRAPFAILALILLGGAASACRDGQPTAPNIAPPRLSESEFDSPALIDDGIDETDTYVLTKGISTTVMTVTSDEAFVDPVTGEYVTTLTLPAIVDSVRFEGGYDPGGTVRVTDYGYGNDGGRRAQRMRIVGNTATFYDADGYVVNDTMGPVLLDAIGTMDDVVVTDGTVIHDDGTDGGSGDDGSEEPTTGAGRRVPGAAAGPTRTRTGDVLRETEDLDDASSGFRGRRIREYRRSGGAWAIRREIVTADETVGGLAFGTRTITEYPVVRWKNNKARDEKRRERRASRKSAPAPAGVLGAMRAPRLASSIPAAEDALPGLAGDQPCACADDGGGDTGGGDGGTGDVAPPPPPVALAYQHGTLSDGQRWDYLDSYLTPRHSITTRVRPTLDWKEPLESQASSLNGELLANGGTDFFVIGHSTGGLAARRAGQFGDGATGSLIRGVLTITTPHDGLPLARNGRRIVNSLLTSHINSVLDHIAGSCWRKQFEWVCVRLDEAKQTFVPNVINYAFDAVVPMSADVAPGSPFLTGLAGRSEGFLGYSVEVHSQGAWKFIRLLGDWRCHPASSCGGNSLQNVMETIYDVLRYCGSNDIARLIKPGLSEKCRNVRWSLSRLNGLYERLTAPGDVSDGVVPGKSQQYPHIPEENRRVLVSSRESHVSAGKVHGSASRVSELLQRHTDRP